MIFFHQLYIYIYTCVCFTVLKENIQKLTNIGQTAEAEDKEKLNANKKNSIDNDYVENMLNVDSNETNLGIYSEYILCVIIKII